MTKTMNILEGFHMRMMLLYDIEKQLEMALPKMATASTSTDLEAAFIAHLEETKKQSKRLEQIFTMLEIAPKEQASETIRGLVTDGSMMAVADAPDSLRDVLIAGAGRNVEHYEISCYLCAIDEAEALGMTDAVELLEITLAEEVAADEKLEMAFKQNLTLAAEGEESVDEE